MNPDLFFLARIVAILATLLGVTWTCIAWANGSRDEFPGRRQGGGTHWEQPGDDDNDSP